MRNERTWLAVTLVASLFAGVCEVLAVTNSWTVDASGSWSEGANWLSATPPGTTDGSPTDDVAFFTNNITSDRTVTIDAGRKINSMVFRDGNTNSPAGWVLAGNELSINPVSVAVGSIRVEALAPTKTVKIAGQLTLDGLTSFYKEGSGTLEIPSGGGVTVTNINNTIGVRDGLVHINGGTLTKGNKYCQVKISPNTATFGGNGAILQSGGTVTISSLTVGDTWGVTASYTLTDGTLEVKDIVSAWLGFVVGSGMEASFMQSGGTMTVDSLSSTASGISSVGLKINPISNIECAFVMTGGSFTLGFLDETKPNSLCIGRGAAGVFTVSNDTAVASLRHLIIGELNTYVGTGTVNLARGTLRIGGGGAAQGAGKAFFNFSGGTLAPYNTNTVIGSATPENNFDIALSGTNAVISSSDKDGLGRTLTLYSKLTGTDVAVTFTGSGTNVLADSNTYTGNTQVNDGTVQWDYPCLDPASDLIVSNGVTLALNFTGTNTIRKLFVDGVSKTKGVYTSSHMPVGVTISGSGALAVTEDESKGTMICIK